MKYFWTFINQLNNSPNSIQIFGFSIKYRIVKIFFNGGFEITFKFAIIPVDISESAISETWGWLLFDIITSGKSYYKACQTELFLEVRLQDFSFW